MAMLLTYADFDKAVFSTDPPNPALPDVTVKRKPDLDGKSFRRLATARIELSAFEAAVKNETADDVTAELPGELGQSDPRMGFGTKQPEWRSPLVEKLKEADKKKDPTP